MKVYVVKSDEFFEVIGSKVYINKKDAKKVAKKWNHLYKGVYFYFVEEFELV